MAKWLGGSLQIMAAVLFVIAGDLNSVGLLLPAIGSGVGGLWIFDRAGRDRGLSPPPAPSDPEVLKEVERLHHILGAIQSDVESLTEDREFYRQLYSGERAGREG